VKVLVLGGGQIGAAVVKAAPKQHEIIALTRAHLDVTDSKAVAKSLVKSKPTGWLTRRPTTAVDRAEDEPQAAAAVNDTAVAALAAGAAREHSRLLHLSTDFVFRRHIRTTLSACRCDQTSERLRSHQTGGRTPCSGGSLGHRPAHIVGVCVSGQEFRADHAQVDERASPDQRGLRSDRLAHLGGERGCGYLGTHRGCGRGRHLSLDGFGGCEWYDFAVAIQEEALERGLLTRAAGVLPIPSAAYPARAKRPSFSVLDTTHTRGMLKPQPNIGGTICGRCWMNFAPRNVFVTGGCRLYRYQFVRHWLANTQEGRLIVFRRADLCRQHRKSRRPRSRSALWLCTRRYLRRGHSTDAACAVSD